MADRAKRLVVDTSSELDRRFETTANRGETHVLTKVKTLLLRRLGDRSLPPQDLVERFARRGVKHAGWRAKDRSQHRVHAVLYDDLLQ